MILIAECGRIPAWHEPPWRRVFPALLGPFGVGCGAILRCSAGAIAAYAPRPSSPFFILGFSPGHAGKYAPEMMFFNSVTAILLPAPQTFSAPGWESVALMACYTAVALLAGATRFSRPDA